MIRTFRGLMKTTEITAIIFDLGGVILNIDYNLPVQAFQKLGYHDFDTLYGKTQQTSMFDKFEKGLVSGEEFVNWIQSHLPNASREEIVSAWNAIIIDFPPHRLDYVKSIGDKLPIFLLSNTNEIHEASFNTLLQSKYNLPSLDPLFQKAYLSHHIGKRKPNADAFMHVLEDQKLDPTHTLFIDDLPQHIATANRLGLQTKQLHSVFDLEQVLTSILA